MAEMNFIIIKNNLYCIHVIVPKYGDKTKPDAGVAYGFLDIVENATFPQREKFTMLSGASRRHHETIPKADV